MISQLIIFISYSRDWFNAEYFGNFQIHFFLITFSDKDLMFDLHALALWVDAIAKTLGSQVVYEPDQ